MFVKIIKEDFTFPGGVSKDCMDLIKKLLIKNPEHRLGNQTDADEIKNHPWFNDVDFDEILERKVNFENFKKIDKSTFCAKGRK